MEEITAAHETGHVTWERETATMIMTAQEFIKKIIKKRVSRIDFRKRHSV